MSKILITTGGTGGHIYPALSVADKLKEKGHDVIFIGTKHRMEKDLISLLLFLLKPFFLI